MVFDPQELGAQLTAVTMGIDAFERLRAPGTGLLDGEGLVPIYMGGELIAPRSYESWEQIRADLAALGDTAAKLPEGPRFSFMRGMLASLQVAVRLFSGASPSFEEKVRDLVGAPVGPVDPAVVDDIEGSSMCCYASRGSFAATSASASKPGRMSIWLARAGWTTSSKR